MNNQKLPNQKDEEELMREMWSPRLTDDPYAFVMFTFPWGKPGTPLEKFPAGPRKWQTDELKKIGIHYREQKRRVLMGENPLVYRSATVSGRGPGKSTLVAFLNLWMMSCHIGAMSITTANTESQLKTKTWAELGKWHTLAVNSHWFDRLALSLKPAAWFESLLKEKLKLDTGYYYAEALLWNEDNPDAFAGAHNYNGTMLIFDEASGIPQKIWDVSEGFFTEPVAPRFWFVFSNPRRNTGPFFDCFHKYREYWPNRRHIDSRTVEGIDCTVLNQIIEKNGEDSDTARVEVKGEFPNQGDEQFIGRDVVDGAVARDVEPDEFEPLIMGVDPARMGRDSAAIVFRRGRDARSLPIITYDKKDNVELANIIAGLINKYDPDAVFIDAGNGTGIIDILKHDGFKVSEVWFGGASSKPDWANKRTEMWADMRDWLKGGMIPDDSDLKADLVGPEKRYSGRSDSVMLESKDEMAKRGIPSPDKADALACTFFRVVPRKDRHANRTVAKARNYIARGTNDYDPLGRDNQTGKLRGY